MDPGFDSSSGFSSDSDSGFSHQNLDRMRVMNVRPLRSLVPVFQTTLSMPLGGSNRIPFTCPCLTGSYPQGIYPFYPFVISNNGDQQAPLGTQPQRPNYGFGGNVPTPFLWNSFVAPPTSQPNAGSSGTHQQPNVGTSWAHQPTPQPNADPSGTHHQPIVLEDDSQDEANFVRNNVVRKRGRPRKHKPAEDVEEFNIIPIINNFLTSFNLQNVDDFRRSCNNKREFVLSILLVYDLIRRKIFQLEDGKESKDNAASIITHRPDLKVGAMLMTKGVRANCTKRIGHVPGVEIGDIFYFRMELCIVGVHSPSMAGIDYTNIKVNETAEEPMAISIVSSAGYKNEMDDCEVLIYSGQGGVQRKDGQTFDQKLEKGNLALLRSLYRGNDVRVIRGLKDSTRPTSKIYIYDGLYKIQDSWVEKNKSSCNVFKYKLVRVPGQPNAFSTWKSIQQWKDGVAFRSGIILTDLSLGVEAQPVALVNDMDDEKGPENFTYTRRLRYTKGSFTSKPFYGCNCFGGCHPTDITCQCSHDTEGLFSYSPSGIVLTFGSLIHECGQSCTCPMECRNRISQAGVKVRFEVFKTADRGWGLRSWDPIRAGMFMCEYAGDVIEVSNNANDYGNINDGDDYVFDTRRYCKPLEGVDDEFVGFGKAPFSVIVSAKRTGNVARFMNHSCYPNVYWQPVLRESKEKSRLHIAFFAIRHIPPLQELTYDYGMVPPEKEHVGRKMCLCGSTKCKGYFY